MEIKFTTIAGAGGEPVRVELEPAALDEIKAALRRLSEYSGQTFTESAGVISLTDRPRVCPESGGLLVYPGESVAEAEAAAWWRGLEIGGGKVHRQL